MTREAVKMFTGQASGGGYGGWYWRGWGGTPLLSRWLLQLVMSVVVLAIRLLINLIEVVQILRDTGGMGMMH